MDITWSLHYCLACDRQTSGGAYCSQSCRLAETDSACRTAFTGLSYTPAAETEAGHPGEGCSTGSGFHLSPAINFATYRVSPTTKVPTDFRPTSSTAPHQPSSATCSPTNTLPAPTAVPQAYPPPTHFSQYYTAQPSTKGLSASSSRSSLSSNASTSSSSSSTTQQIHDQISNELRAYANSFDTTRHWRRRTWS